MMREIIISFILVSIFSITLNTPPQPEVQAEKQHKTSIQASQKPKTQKVVKSATKKKKPVSKPTVQPQVVSQPAAPVRPAAVPVSGTCAEWMRAAGVSGPDANFLIIKESGCRPDAINPTSGACGIPQALPCSKMQCSLSDPVCQLKWMDNYVKSRYGSWANAKSFWVANNWY